MRRLPLVAVAILVGCLYHWIARTANDKVYWKRTAGGGFYEYLGRALAHGHLYLPIAPSPELLAQANPWDAALEERYVVHDLAFFNGRYYLYHGAGPAVMLFLPWQLITGYSLPEPYAALILCFGGYLFSCATLLRIFTLADVRPSPGLAALSALALGLCQCVPYLLNRVFMYEIAISGGYFSMAAAAFFLARAIRSPHAARWMAASGLMFGMAISCRPHLGLAAAAALGWVALTHARSRPREFLAFLAPLCAAGAVIALYNYARFSNPFEFGMRLMLGLSRGYRDPHPAWRNLPPGFYFTLFCAPDLSPVFPFVRQVFRNPFNRFDYAFPDPYFIEQMTGALYLAPMLVGALLAPLARPVRGLLAMLLACALAALLFICSVGLSAQRFEVDFLAPALVASLAAFGIAICRSRGWKRAALTAILIAGTAWGALTGLAFGITGPLDSILQNRPATYMRVARWFSPIERFRPLLNPRITAGFTAEFAPRDDGFGEPLLTIGQGLGTYCLIAERAAGKLRIVSQSGGSVLAHEMPMPSKPVSFRVAYAPESGNVTTAADGQEILTHHIGALLTAPAQITVGENRAEPVVVPRFTGRIRTDSLAF